MGPTTRTLVTTIQAVWLAGGVLVMLPLPMRMGSIAQFIEQIKASGVRVLTMQQALVETTTIAG